MRKPLAVAAATALAACALTAAPADAATITTKGTGWKLTTQLGVTSISPSRQYTITFAAAALKTRYTPYLTAAVAQAKAAGVRLAIGGVEAVNPAKCGPVGHIQAAQHHRPRAAARPRPRPSQPPRRGR
ncbi:hypothetical protein OHT20_06565 [Streptomyces caniferus]|uniref:Uncharacterized protein n=1 Tax=Streptomyces caniferus TaxID=285557 RepID=A0ABZ1VF76_9ACTN|nr:hypothetical protein [Streptomyces caniferus]